VLKNAQHGLVVNSILGPVCYNAPSTTFTVGSGGRVGLKDLPTVSSIVQYDVKEIYSFTSYIHFARLFVAFY
jgi:hypothetical protein